MDDNGKVIWARQHEILTANVRTLPDLATLQDGERLLASSKELGQCEIFPQRLQHSPNGRFVAVCGDGEYIIYTAVAWRNRAFGKGMDFCWSASSNEYAVKEAPDRLQLNANFTEAGTIRLPSVCERLFSGALLGVAMSGAQLCFYDWQSSRLVRRIDVEATAVHWCPASNRLAICATDSIYLLQYRPSVLQAYLQQGRPIPEDGIEEAFEVIDDIQERALSGLWVDGCFVYVNDHGRISYHVVGSQSAQLAIPDRQLFLLGYLAEEGKLLLTDKDANLVVYGLAMTVVAYEAALLSGDLGRAAQLLPAIPPEQRNRVAHLLEGQGRLEEAFSLAQDPEFRFDLAVRLGRLDVASELAEKGEAASDHKWRLLGDRALADWKFSLAEKCFWRGNDLTSLLLLYTASGNASGLERLAQAATEAGELNIAFTCYFSSGRTAECYELLKLSGEPVEAALFARTYLPSKVDEAAGLWTDRLANTPGAPRIDQKLAAAIARPSQNPELFVITKSVEAEGAVKAQVPSAPIPSAPFPSAPVPVPSGESSASRPRNVSFDEKVTDTGPALVGSYSATGLGSIGPMSVTTTTTSEHMSLEVNTTGTGSITQDLDDMASMRTFPSVATAGQLDLDRLTIHDELPEDQLLSEAEDDVRNPKPSADLFSYGKPEIPVDTLVPPVPAFNFQPPMTDFNDELAPSAQPVDEDDPQADEEPADEPDAADEQPKATSPLQNINLQGEEDDWL